MEYYTTAKKYFDRYVSSFTESDISELIKQKRIHTNEVIVDGVKTINKLNFSDSFVDFTKIALLNHDVGRFLQAHVTKSFNDIELHKFCFDNHGELGKHILKSGLIYSQIPTTRYFDEPIFEIVNNHVTKVVDPKQLLILSSNLLKSQEAVEFFMYADEKIKQKVIDAITQVVQDVDRLDIYHQIIDGRWKPCKSDKKIDELVLNKFYNGEYLNIIELRKQGLWNSNVGELVRLSFINQIRLLSVAQIIKEENLLEKMRKKQTHSQVIEAFDFTIDKLNKLIKKSDGIII